MASGTLWQRAGTDGNASQQIKSSDLPVTISGLTVIYAPAPHSFWDAHDANFISYELVESRFAVGYNTSEPTAGLAHSSNGTVTIQNVPYSGSQFQTADLQTCLRLCHAYPRCHGVEFLSVPSESQNCKIIVAEINIDVSENVVNEETVMCYAKNKGPVIVIEPRLLVEALQGGPVKIHYGFDKNRSGSCRPSTTAVDSTDINTDGSDDNDSATAAGVAVLLLVVLCAAGVYYYYTRQKSGSATLATVQGGHQSFAMNEEFVLKPYGEDPDPSGDAEGVLTTCLGDAGIGAAIRSESGSQTYCGEISIPYDAGAGERDPMVRLLKIVDTLTE